MTKSKQEENRDISDILARKEAGRRSCARLSFGEKIARVEALRERLAPFKRAREARERTRLLHAMDR
jgi:hypothetical protein